MVKSFFKKWYFLQYAPCFAIPCGLGTRYICLLTTCGPKTNHNMTNHYQGLLQPQGELHPIQTIFNHCSQGQLLEFCSSFSRQLALSSLSKGNFKHTQFSWNHWNWWDSNLQPHAPKGWDLYQRKSRRSEMSGLVFWILMLISFFKKWYFCDSAQTCSVWSGMQFYLRGYCTPGPYF